MVRSAYDPEYQRAHIKQQSRRGQQMKRLRQSTVEPVFGSLVQHYGLNKINVLGREGAHKNMLMAAVALNIKKYLKTVDRKSTKSDAMQAPTILNNGLMLL
ncbi:MAG: transposase [Dyadobacter sp.]